MSVSTRVPGHIHAQLRTLIGSAGIAKMRRSSGPVLGSEIWTPKRGPCRNIFLMTDPILGSEFWTPKWGPARWFTWGQCAVKNSFSPASQWCFTARLAVPVSFLLSRQADCCSQVRVSANWGGPSQRDRFFCVDFLPPFWGHLKCQFCCKAAGGV